MPEPRGEFARIAAIVRGLAAGAGVIVGPGDDAAVLRPREGRDLVATTDTFAEGRHFRRDLLSPAEAGRRLAAANLSDLAAMAAEPRWALIALALPGSWPAGDAEALERACAGALEAEGAAIVGGNLSACDGPACVTVTLLGEVERGRHWTRPGARPGDLLAMTGSPGRAAATLALALAGGAPSLARVPRALAGAYVAPPCRVRAARALAAAGGVRACVDVSDGLAGDLAHLCEAGGVGAILDRLPADPELERAAGALGATTERALEALRLGPSDDYELLLAIDPARFDACAAAAAAAGAPLSRLGAITAEPGRLAIRRAGGALEPIAARGYDHFA